MSETAERSPGLAGTPPGGPATGQNEALALLRRLGVLLTRQREATVFVVAAALFLYFALNPGSSSAFVSKANLVTLFSNPSNASGIAIIALGEVFLLISGEIDLSVGFVVGFAPYLMHFLTDFYGFPGLLAILFALLFGAVVGMVNGFFTVTLGLPSFITTLGTSFILLGLIGTTSHDEPASIPPDVLGIGKWIAVYSWSDLVWAIVADRGVPHRAHRGPAGACTRSPPAGTCSARARLASTSNRIKYGNFMISGMLGALVGLQTMYFTSNIDPHRGLVHADVLRGRRRGDRRHRDAGRLRDDHRRVLRRDRAGDAASTASDHRA